jgi:hypothetical protein
MGKGKNGRCGTVRVTSRRRPGLADFPVARVKVRSSHARCSFSLELLTRMLHSFFLLLFSKKNRNAPLDSKNEGGQISKSGHGSSCLREVIHDHERLTQGLELDSIVSVSRQETLGRVPPRTGRSFLVMAEWILLCRGLRSLVLTPCAPGSNA